MRMAMGYPHNIKYRSAYDFTMGSGGDYWKAS